jgi:hypothetical protein
MNEIINELIDLLYTKLKESANGELSFDEIFILLDSKPEYGLNKIQGTAIRSIRERHNVEQLKDKNDRPYLKLIS